MSAPAAVGRVLPTMNEDGSRRWIRPRPSHGRWNARRRVVAWALMFVFLAIPHIQMAGRPLILLDVPRREFTIFGVVFLPTDTLLLMLLLASIIIAVFLATALFGRVWCGWACPQTVYMEFLFRPIERLFEGGRSGSMKLDREGRNFHPRRLAKYAVYGVLSLFLAHTFLAYFVGSTQLTHWVTRPPAEHPSAFVVMAVTAVLIFADFTYFREQVCLVACPYGRWQSVLLDRSSLVVAYDTGRGEPRTKGREQQPGAGDCVDCSACVATCPTGIDIRDGLQMECIHCTQCMDACDDVMTRLRRPRGLIRYTSRAALETGKPHILRARVILYPLALLLFVGSLAYALAHRDAADITVLRGIGAPFEREVDGRVSNQIRVKVTNRSRREQAYTISLHGAGDATLVAPENPLTVAPNDSRTTSVFVLLNEHDLHDGARDVTVRVSAGNFAANVPYRLLGPDDEDHRAPGDNR